MPRNDGVRYGAGGQVLQEIVEAPKGNGNTLAQKQNKKVEILEERIVDTIPSDVEPEEEKNEDV